MHIFGVMNDGNLFAGQMLLFWSRSCARNHKMECTTFKAYGWYIDTGVHHSQLINVYCGISHMCVWVFFLLFNFGFFPLFLSTVAMLDAMPLSFSFNHNQIKALNNDCACIRYLSSMWCDERAMQMNHNTKYNNNKNPHENYVDIKMMRTDKKNIDNSNNKCHKY